MKKLFIILTTLMMCGVANAQNSEAESTFIKETKAEKFLRKATLYREDTHLTMYEDGITAYVKVATDLITNEKIGYCYFETEAEKWFAREGEEGAAEPLGYLDLEQIDDMILALEKILENTKIKSKVRDYFISYRTESGINVHYNGKKGVYYSKKFYYINENGIERCYELESPKAALKSLTKTIDMLEKAKTIINQNIK